MAKARGFIDALGPGKGPRDRGFAKTRKQIKRATSKLARRLGRRMLEDAPVRVTRGYAD